MRPLLVLGMFFFTMSPPGAFAQDGASAALEQMKPGAEHEALSKLVGAWELELSMGQAAASGAAEVVSSVGGRFIEIDYQAGEAATATEGRFILGFDRRHEHYALIAMDSFGTYFVTSQGKPDPESGRVKMYGTDDDPHMASLGFGLKEFVHVLEVSGDDAFAIEVHWIDTRTDERKETLAMTYRFSR